MAARSRLAGRPARHSPLKISDQRMLQWFVRELGPHRWRLAIGFVAMAASAASDVAIPWVLSMLIIKQVIEAGQKDMLARYMAIELGLFVTSAVFSAMRMNIMHQLGQRLTYKMRVVAYEHTQKLGLTFFHSHNTGDIMSRLSNDVGAVEDMVVTGPIPSSAARCGSCSSSRS